MDNHDVIHKTGSTRHSPVLHCRRRTEPLDVVFEMCERTDRHTDTLIATLRTPTGVKVKLGLCNERSLLGIWTWTGISPPH